MLSQPEERTSNTIKPNERIKKERRNQRKKQRNKETRTKEGFEMHFGVNHLGHFLLTMLLLDKLKQAKSIARIINVSSSLYFAGTIQFDDINMDHNFDKTRAYGQSKLANILFTRELAKRTKGTNIRAYSLHPGN